jgi:hypothetical protein
MMLPVTTLSNKIIFSAQPQEKENNKKNEQRRLHLNEHQMFLSQNVRNDNINDAQQKTMIIMKHKITDSTSLKLNLPCPLVPVTVVFVSAAVVAP